MTAPTPEARCELAHAAGLTESCPGEACLFWAAEEGCAIAALRPELGGNLPLAHLLLGLRRQIEHREPYAFALPGLDS